MSNFKIGDWVNFKGNKDRFSRRIYEIEKSIFNKGVVVKHEKFFDNKFFDKDWAYADYLELDLKYKNELQIKKWLGLDNK